MNTKNVNFGDKKMIKRDFYKNRKVTTLHDSDPNILSIFKEESYSAKISFKYSIGYNDNDVIRPLSKKA